ncbi:Arginine--tRNA ligase [Rubrobacter xylanophilus DSM 9941]|uniref:arginine--tRNA ligase n=1 Tax=Rubrobacter xylanophilus TaxID=49319 RepID=UPI001C63C022|nr:arginine--tRNA ligase [Rubrobacter xylanophilus]QYJ14929.1 Arginine--tRNA ligase [Rubrobacter xylanophilus DSM 9941]
MSFEGRIAEAVRGAVREAYGLKLDGVHVERPNDPRHGDFATNVALANARTFRRNPREVAEELAGRLRAPFVREIEVAGPGFINFRLAPEAVWEEVGVIVREGTRYGRVPPSGDPINVEFVSANPTGPLHVAHGRHAAYGDALARILEAAGRRVSREYYFNDGGNQIRLFGESVADRYARLHGRTWPVSDPDALYKGDYTEEIARDLSREHGDALLRMEREEALDIIADFAARWCMEDIKRTLERVRVRFDTYFNEKSLYESGAVGETVQRLKRAGCAYEKDGALWLASSRFGDDKDRVLVKSDGSYTYVAPDIAYHLDKWSRGFRRAINILGADHAGYGMRLRAGLVALGLPEDFLDVELVRLVKLVREGQQVKFSKRAGNIVTLDELLDEVGVDAARYFYVRSSHRNEMNFDLDLAIRQSEENPVYYVQYAHARICSIFRRSGEEVPEAVLPGELTPEERLLALELIDFPRVVRGAADRREVHPVPAYLEALATRFHQFYTAHRVLVDDPEVRARRLALCAATRNVLAAGLGLLGVRAPERM